MTTPSILTSIHGKRVGLGPNGELIVNGARVTGATPPDLWAGAPSLNDPDPSQFHRFFDDFYSADAHTYTSVDDAGTGTNAYQDAAGGVYSVVTAAADNDYHAMTSVAENWLFASGKELWFEARFKLAEANTNESAWWMGFTDTLTTGGLQANTSGPLASYDGALFWKDEATMAIDFETSNAGTQNTGTALATFVTNTWTRVGMYFDGDPSGSGTGTVTPYTDVGSGWVEGTAQDIVLSGLAEMHLVFGVKAGPSGGAETLQMDYVKAVQLR